MSVDRVIQVPGGGPTHGTGGPPVVLPGGFFTDLGEQFIQVARKLNPYYAKKLDDTDVNDLETVNVCAVSVFSIDPGDGGRLRVAHTGGRGGPSTCILPRIHRLGSESTDCPLPMEQMDE